MKASSRLLLVVAALGFFAFAGLGTARAQDDSDPTVFLGSSATALNGGGFSTMTESGTTWLYPPSGVAVAGTTGTTYLSFENTGTSAWTSATILATMDSTSGHSFTCDPTSAPEGTQAFSSCTPGTPAATTELYSFTGGSIGVDDYLVFTWNNFPTNSGNGPLNFGFTVNGGSSAVPETGTLLLLGIGLIGLTLTWRVIVNRQRAEQFS